MDCAAGVSGGPPRLKAGGGGGGAGRGRLRPVHQSVLSEGPACELWEACADADAGADQHRGGDAGGLGGAVLGREPVAGAAALRAVAGGGGDHGASDVCAARVSSWRRGIGGRGAKVVLGGLHVLVVSGGVSRRMRIALAIGEGVQLWPRDPARRGEGKLGERSTGRSYLKPYREDPAAAAGSLAAEAVSDHDEPDRDARLSQPVRVLLPGDGGVAPAVPGAGRGAGRRGV